MGWHERFRTVSLDNERFLTANRDLLQRMEEQGLSVLFDDVLDTVFIDIGRHSDGTLEPATDNIMMRVDPQNHRVLGYEITDFTTDFLPHNRMFKSLVEDLGLLGRPNEAISLSQKRERDKFHRFVEAVTLGDAA